jgi:hypothetical protein
LWRIVVAYPAVFHTSGLHHLHPLPKDSSPGTNY